MDLKQANPVDEDLDRLEHEMRRLKVEYDIYFNGGTLRPPIDTKGRVETSIKRIYDSRGMSFGQRFRYNSLVARYNVMRELWRRQTQDREEIGRPPTPEAQTVLREYTSVIRCHDPKLEPEKVSELYDHLIAAKRECGERIGALSLEMFTRFLTSRASHIKDHLAADAVDFVIGVDNGRVKFAARPAAAGKEVGSMKDEG
ncbi:MAG TPA: MXAN_5187 C-terminal domain-containing protein [Blastocatellia bacterium]|nr:MXAN_5187 C-terminal domain-containing protein [Blastocatellia bacterium]